MVCGAQLFFIAAAKIAESSGYFGSLAGPRRRAAPVSAPILLVPHCKGTYYCEVSHHTFRANTFQVRQPANEAFFPMEVWFLGLD